MVKKRVIVSVATHDGYLRRQERQIEACERFAKGIDRKIWSGCLPAGSPPHKDVPYGFKLHAIKECMDAGYTTILWLDSPVGPVRDIRPLFDRIEADGHYLFHGGDPLAQRCGDICCKIVGIVRDDWWDIMLLGGTVYGLDMTHERTRDFFAQWFDAMERGAFCGPYVNAICGKGLGLVERGVGWASHDIRVTGHSHDESVATIVAEQLGMKSASLGTSDCINEPWRPEGPSNDTIILHAGFPD